MTFLKRAWATLTTLPVYATALTAGVTEGARALGAQLPAGQSGAVLHAAAAVVAVIGFGAYVVTRVEEVAPEARGFPQASLSQKAQDLLDLQTELDAARSRIANLEAVLAPPSPSSDPHAVCVPAPTP